MYGKYVSIGCMRVFVPCSPKCSDSDLMRIAKAILKKWVSDGCPMEDNVKYYQPEF